MMRDRNMTANARSGRRASRGRASRAAVGQQLVFRQPGTPAPVAVVRATARGDALRPLVLPRAPGSPGNQPAVAPVRVPDPIPAAVLAPPQIEVGMSVIVNLQVLPQLARTSYALASRLLSSILDARVRVLEIQPFGPPNLAQFIVVLDPLPGEESVFPTSAPGLAIDRIQVRAR